MLATVMHFEAVRRRISQKNFRLKAGRAVWMTCRDAENYIKKRGLAGYRVYGVKAGVPSTVSGPVHMELDRDETVSLE